MIRAVAPLVWIVLIAGATGGCRGDRVSEDKVERLRRSKDAGSAVNFVDRSGTSGMAELVHETEPNSDAVTANPMTAGARNDAATPDVQIVGARGELDGEIDVDVFRVTATGPQHLSVRVTGLDKIDLKLEVRDSSFAVLARSDRAGAGVSEGVVGLPVTAGTYFVVVSEFVKRKKTRKAVDAGVGRTGRSATYEVSAELTTAAASGAEREPNGDVKDAAELILGETVTGWIGWSSDVDIWQLGIDAFTEANGLDLVVTGVERVALALAISDGANHHVMKVQGGPGQEVTLHSLVPRRSAGAAPVYYLTRSGRPSNPEVPYTLTVTSRLLEVDEEAEPNQETATATPLRSGDETQGAMRAMIDPGDIDVFVLSESANPTALEVAMDPPPNLDVAIKVSTVGGVVLGSADVGGVGAAESLVAISIPADQRVSVEVVSKKAKKPVGSEAYRVRWSVNDAVIPELSVDSDPLPPEE